MKKLLAFLLLLPSIAFAQGTQHDRIHSRGQSTFDSLANTATVIITGATPSVSGGNVFKTNNAGVTTVTNFLGGADSQQITVICGDANTTIANGTSIVTASGTNFACGVNQSIAFIYDAGQGKWVQSGSVSGGAGSVPGAPANSVQKNSGSGTFTASSITDNGTTVTVANEAQFCGINPNIDIRCYGARAVTSVPTTTATISATSTTATLAASSGLQNGDGVRIDGAGATNALSTPGTITVTPVVAKGLLGTGEVVTSVAGSTTYNYQRVARDKLGALTAASTVGSTTTGQATLGAITVNISTITRSNNVVTVTVSTATPLVPNAAVWILGNADTSFNGAYQVATTPSGTQFTFTSGVDTRSGGATSTSGGTVTYYVGNRLTWTAGTEWQDYIYGRTGGSLTRIGPTRPLENRFDDWGATIMGSPAFPSYVPSSPPVSATNDPLITTIVSGGGTTTLTLAAAATNSVSSAVLKFDDAPNIKAAHDAAGSIPIYIPSTPSGTFVVNSYLNLNPFPSASTNNIIQSGTLTLNETLEFEGGMVWQGQGGSGAVAPGFDWSQQASISCITATPCVYDNSPGGGVRVERLALDNENDQAILWLVEGGPGFQRTYDNMAFVTGNPSTAEDYLGISFLARAGSEYKINRAGFSPHMNNAGPTGLFAPVILMTGNEWTAGYSSSPTGTGKVSLSGIYTSAKGTCLDYTVQFAALTGTVDGYYTQGARTPMFTFTQGFSGLLASLWTIKNTINDTSFAPTVSNLTTSLNQLTLENIYASTGAVSVTGNPINNLVVNAANTPLGPNTNLISGPNFSNNFVNVNNQGFFGTILPTPTAPTLSVGSGGLPAETVYYAIAAIDINGRTTAIGPSASITIPINSSVNVIPPTLPSGSVGYLAYVSHDGVSFVLTSMNHIGTCNTPWISAGVTFIDQDNFTCGASAPTTTNAAQSSLGAPGLSSPALKLMTNGFTTTITSTATASRSITFPDATGTICLSGGCTINAVILNGETLSFSPRSMPPIFFPGALTTPWTGASWTLDKPITVTRLQSAVRVAPVSCSTSAVIRLTDGTTPVNLTINAATNDSGAITQNYAAGATLTVSVVTAANGCTTSPGDLNFVVTSRMQ